MRYGVVIGSAAAVLVLVATAGLVLRGGSGPGTETDARPPAIAHPQATPDKGGQLQADRVPQPQAPHPPSFDVLKVGPSGTAVIAGRAEPGATVTVRDAGRIIGEVTADRRGEWVLIPERPLDPASARRFRRAPCPASPPPPRQPYNLRPSSRLVGTSKRRQVTGERQVREAGTSAARTRRSPLVPYLLR